MTGRPGHRARSADTAWPQTVGDLLPGVLDDLGVADKVWECRVLMAWEQIAGQHLAAHARAVRLRKGRLELVVPSAVWRTHLSFSKEHLLARLNGQLGSARVKDLAFANGELPHGAGGGLPGRA